MMHAKWAMSGAESVLKVYPGKSIVLRSAFIDHGRWLTEGIKQAHAMASRSSLRAARRRRKKGWTILLLFLMDIASYGSSLARVQSE